MKLYGIFIMRKNTTASDPTICCAATDLSSISFLQRSAAKEFLVFLARTVAQRVSPGGAMSQVNEGDKSVWAQSAAGNIVAVAIGDKDYHFRVAFSMLSQVLQDFQVQFRGKYENADGSADNFLTWPELANTLKKYQNPEEADKVLRIRRDIEQTKVIMYDAVDALLSRGEKIESLVEKSADLSSSSKTFYKEAKKTNSCCALL